MAFDPPHPKPAQLAPVEQGAPDPRVSGSGTYLVDERRERRAVHHGETLPTRLHAERPARYGSHLGHLRCALRRRPSAAANLQHARLARGLRDRTESPQNRVRGFQADHYSMNRYRSRPRSLRSSMRSVYHRVGAGKPQRHVRARLWERGPQVLHTSGHFRPARRVHGVRTVLLWVRGFRGSRSGAGPLASSLPPRSHLSEDALRRQGRRRWKEVRS